jgi:PAS domain S-box-containing protein
MDVGSLSKKPNKNDSLRTSAEEKLAHAYALNQNPRPTEDILHELHVHQIELEMQNENLRQSQNALEASRDRYVDLYEFAPLGYFTLTREGVIAEANLTGAALLGVERNKLSNRHFAGFVDAADRDSWHRYFLNVLLRNMRQSCELTLRHGNGSLFNSSLNCLRVGTEDAPLVRIALTDITARKQAEDNLRIAATAFQTHESLMITDANRVIIRVNQAFIDETGYSSEEIVGQTSSILKSDRHDAAFYRGIWEGINQTGKWEGEIWDRRKNGEIYPKWLSMTAVKDQHGVVTHYVGSHTDITVRKEMSDKLHATTSELMQANAQVEEERAMLAQRVVERTGQLLMANRAKDSFLATMSHEIRTPLGGLLGLMELLTLSPLDAKQQELVKAAHSSGNSLLRIVNDILDWSRIEAGKLELVPYVGTLSEMFNGVADTYAQIASEKGLQLKITIDPALSNAHICDFLRVSQILNNFTSNAIKFTEHGSIELRAKQVARHSGREEIRFSVSDSGIGISQAQQDRLFQEYTQATADTARMYGGTGLGLAICRKLADLMDGQLGVESNAGAGSTFSLTVSLPVANQAAQRELQQRSHKNEGREDRPNATALSLIGQPLTILIVDDHPLNRMMLKLQLELLGVQVETAESGISALSLWQNGHFDLIITDCHMPEMDGYELTYRIRDLEQQAGSRRIPIIAWTANVMAEEEEHCKKAGMDDLLTKPTELADLRAMLVKLLTKIDVQG